MVVRSNLLNAGETTQAHISIALNQGLLFRAGGRHSQEEAGGASHAARRGSEFRGRTAVVPLLLLLFHVHVEKEKKREKARGKRCSRSPNSVRVAGRVSEGPRLPASVGRSEQAVERRRDRCPIVPYTRAAGDALRRDLGRQSHNGTHCGRWGRGQRGTSYAYVR